MSRFFVSLLLVAALIAPQVSSATTIDDLQSQINSLLATIASMQAQLTQLSGGSAQGGASSSSGSSGTATAAPTPTPAALCQSITRNLRIGDSGDDVRHLQEILTKAGYSPDTGGTYGERTAAAVTAFQETFSVEILYPVGLKNGTGFFGTGTRAKFNRLYECGGSTVIAPPATVTPPVLYGSSAVCAQPPWTCPSGLACPAVMPAPTTYPNEDAAKKAGATILYRNACVPPVQTIAPTTTPLYAVKQCDGSILYTHDPNAVVPTCSQPDSVPVISSVSPQVAKAGDTVYVGGSGFASQGSYISFVNASSSAITGYVSPNKLSFIVPPLAPNTYKISVREKASDVESNSVDFTIQAVSATTNQAPAQTTITLSSIYPESGPAGTLVKLTGCGPESVDGYNLIYSGPASGSVKIPVVATSGSCGYMQVSIPSDIPSGTYTVSVKNNSTGQTSANSLAFVVTPKADTAVTLTSISPASGPSGTTVTINGCGSESALGYSAIYTGPAYGVLDLKVSPTTTGCGSMTYVVPAGAPVGTYYIYVRNNATNQLSKNNLEFVVTEGKAAYPTTSSLPTTQMAGVLNAIQMILESMLQTIAR